MEAAGIKIGIPSEIIRNAKYRRSGVTYKVTHVIANVPGEAAPQRVISVTYNEARNPSGMGPIHATVNVNFGEISLSGSGNASGCGYHKESAALNEALDSAGITIETERGYLHFGGMGTSVSEAVLCAIAAKITGLPYGAFLVLDA